MSITFYIDGWNEKEEESSIVKPPYDADDSKWEAYELLMAKARNEGLLYPEINMANGNFITFGKFIGLPWDMGNDYCGAIPVEEIPGYIAKCTELMNNNSTRNNEYLARRLEEFLEMLKIAHSDNKGIYWA